MNRSELLKIAKQVRFTTRQVKATLDGNMTEFRLPISAKTIEKGTNWFWNPNENICFAPYQKGDIIYVRETWQAYMKDDDIAYRYLADAERKNIVYTDLDDEPIKWRSSACMPKEAARLFLQVANVRAERVQDITDEGAKAEGIRGWTKDGKLYKYGHIEPGDIGSTPWRDMPRTAVEAYAKLWDSIYKSRGYGWDKNPWEFATKFKRIEVS